MTFSRYILCWILPPVAVYRHVGVTEHFWINIALSMLGWIPGAIHALWVMRYKNSEK